jgi:hypothetical protein
MTACMLAGAAAAGGLPRVQLPSSIGINTTHITLANSALQITNAGDLKSQQNGAALADFDDWMVPKQPSVAGLYSVYFELGSGVLTSGTVNTWLPCDVSRTWNVVRSTFGITTVTATLYIAFGAAIQASCPVTLSAQRSGSEL